MWSQKHMRVDTLGHLCWKTQVGWLQCSSNHLHSWMTASFHSYRVHRSDKHSSHMNLRCWYSLCMSFKQVDCYTRTMWYRICGHCRQDLLSHQQSLKSFVSHQTQSQTCLILQCRQRQLSKLDWIHIDLRLFGLPQSQMVKLSELSILPAHWIERSPIIS